jgi:integrase
MGLGKASLRAPRLAEARKLADEARDKIDKGIDPIDSRRTDRKTALVKKAQMVTFKAHAEEFYDTHKSTWKNAKHVAQWRMTLDKYIYPKIGNMPVRDVDVAAVMSVIKPLWRLKTETASRCRGRIEMVLNSAAAEGLRSRDNPAQWRGVLEHKLPAKSVASPVQHHKAMDYAEVASFVSDLQSQEGMSARALEFLILTCMRTGEVIGAQWTEIDLKKRVWRVPATRMKGRKGKSKYHEVPLSAPALKLLRALPGKNKTAFVFPGGKDGLPLSNNALLALLKRMKRNDITPHGFRSCYRDWAADETSYPREVCEMVLAHSIGDQSELAYKRTDLFKKRKALMADWAIFCNKEVK